MSLRRPSKDQPEIFEFNSSSLEAAKNIISMYPEGKQQSALCCLPSGYIEIIFLAASNEEELNSKISGWSFEGLLKLIYQLLQKLYP